MKDVVASCAAGYLDSTALLDMNYMEDSGGGPDVVVAVHAKLDKVVVLQMDNKLPLETLETVRPRVSWRQSRDLCASLYKIAAAATTAPCQDYLSRSSEWTWRLPARAVPS